MIRRLILAAAAVAAFAASTLTADARVAIGTLECRSPGTISFIVTLNQYDCRFFSKNGRAYQYRASVGRIGYEAGITGRETLVWGVFAPTSRVDHNALRGTYIGAHANATIGAGVGANVLVGGSGRTISLQPVSVEGRTGLSAGISAAGFTIH